MNVTWLEMAGYLAVGCWNGHSKVAVEAIITEIGVN
jgi:hypothetical protein